MPILGQPEKLSIGTLLGPESGDRRPLAVPKWQRSYSWKAEQVEEFWDDLVGFTGARLALGPGTHEYFVGSVILVVTATGDSREILDGQQRLATSVILAAALRNVIRPINARSADGIEQRFLFATDEADNQRSRRLHLNFEDDEFFDRYIVQSNTFPPLRGLRKSHKLIRAAYLLFEDKIAKGRGTRNDEQFLDWCLGHYKTLRDSFTAIVIATRDAEQASEVFETLNDRGIGLSASELVRTYLLQRAEARDIDGIVRHWSRIFEYESQPKFRNFLRHYWISHHGDVKARALSKTIKRYIGLDSNAVDSLQFSADLAESAVRYAAIVSGIAQDDLLKRRLSDVNLLDAQPLYPAILSAFETYDLTDVTVRRTVARFLDAFIAAYVRHTVIGGLETTRFESMAFASAASIRGDAFDLETAINALKTFAPNDEQFRASFAAASVENDVAQYLFRAIERYRRGAESEVDVASPGSVHVEHVYPQSPPTAEKWELHDAYVDRIGNLTLLSGPPNQRNGNALYPAKRESYKASELLCNRLLGYLKEWSAETISDRQKALAAEAVEIWEIKVAR